MKTSFYTILKRSEEYSVLLDKVIEKAVQLGRNRYVFHIQFSVSKYADTSQKSKSVQPVSDTQSSLLYK